MLTALYHQANLPATHYSPVDDIAKQNLRWCYLHTKEQIQFTLYNQELCSKIESGGLEDLNEGRVFSPCPRVPNARLRHNSESSNQ